MSWQSIPVRPHPRNYNTIHATNHEGVIKSEQRPRPCVTTTPSDQLPSSNMTDFKLHETQGNRNRVIPQTAYAASKGYGVLGRSPLLVKAIWRQKSTTTQAHKCLYRPIKPVRSRVDGHAGRTIQDELNHGTRLGAP
ncbi:hypothetical protein ASPTUDRAFT_830460 [Aspergillus tubingensis CBS 134.48]|uniref:Uncharacterized protein n=1 Tax=Aspergillus tubingensis (strain CBS 134.48) TaxID=767770 RepID=A0A1L9MWX1_ASPTC|nr:hypothetical protein ASPTUDRAFT_830460 [Aspergillus tubingensis CBS 134.48]